MRSKLEPGCKAIVVSAECQENLAKIVTCLRFVGEQSPCQGSDLWEVDTIMVRKGATTGKKYPSNNLIQGKNLQRIDDDEENETTEVKEELKTHL